MELQGFKELDKKLRSLGPSVGGRFLRSAAMQAMTPVVQTARKNAPVGVDTHRTYKGRLVAPGFLKRSVKKRAFLSRNKQFVSVAVGVEKEAYYGVRFLEGGTKYVEANPWLEPSFESNQAQVMSKFKSSLIKKIESASKKA